MTIQFGVTSRATVQFYISWSGKRILFVTTKSCHIAPIVKLSGLQFSKISLIVNLNAIQQLSHQTESCTKSF